MKFTTFLMTFFILVTFNSLGQGSKITIKLPSVTPGSLPTQTGNSGKYLTTNGTTTSWATVAGGGGDWSSITGKPTTLAGYGITDNITLQGNTFNGVNQLVQLNASGFLPALNGSLLTALTATNLTTGTLPDARLSTNVVTLTGTQTLTNKSIASTQLTYPAVQTLSDAATITWNYATSYSGSVTLAGNRTLAITNMVANTFGVLKITQDATGGRTIAFPANSKFPNGLIALSTAANAVDILTFWNDGTNLNWNIQKDVR
jgi:hypothetical protein